MKRLSLLILFIAFAGILYISENDSIPSLKNQAQNFSKYENGVLKSETLKYKDVANYDFEIDFNADSKTIYVKENITWINRTEYSTKEIQFHLYPNAYKNTKTELC